MYIQFFCPFAFQMFKILLNFSQIFQACDKKLVTLALKPKFFHKDGEFLPLLDAIPMLQEAMQEVYRMGLANAKNTQIDKVKKGLRDQRSNF